MHTFLLQQKKSHFTFIFVALLCCMPFTLHTNDINLRIQHYTTDEGLSQNYVDCIYRDSHGFIWVGTWDGLNRFDGYSFITYRPEDNPNTISDGFINDIIEDSEGNLWIATRNGINKFVYETETFIHYFHNDSLPQNTISNNWISSLLLDHEENLWIGTSDHGVEKIVFNDDRVTIDTIYKLKVDILDSMAISNEYVYSLLQSADSSIYIGTLIGLDKINPKTGVVEKFIDINHPFFMEATVIHNLFEDSKGIIWIGTESGLVSIDQKNNAKVVYPVDRISKPGTNKKALSHGLVKDIEEDPNGNILVATLGGLHVLDKNTQSFDFFPVNNNSRHSLNSLFINDILCDSNGNVWVGTDKGGLNKYNVFQKAFYFYANDPNDDNTLNHNIVNSISEKDPYLWIGTAGGGLNLFNKNTRKFSHFTHQPGNSKSISLDYISALAHHPNKKEIWIGTWGCGLNKGKVKENGKIEFETYLYEPVEPDGPPFIYISSLSFDKAGNLWIGQANGLSVYDEIEDRFYQVQTASENNINATGIGYLYLDQNNVLWIGSTNGLYIYPLDQEKTAKELSQPDSIYHFLNNPDDSTSLPNNFVVSILEDQTGKIWVSNYGKGISKLEHLDLKNNIAQFSNYDTENGLSSNVVYGILEDDSNNLWLSTDRGLTRFNYKNFETHSFYEKDGLQSNQFYWSAFFKNTEGTMYFGSTAGMNYFNPNDIKLNNIAPNVAITDFRLFNKSKKPDSNQEGPLNKTISVTEEINLNYDENIISFEFSSLSYMAPERNQYEYIMEGFDNDWTKTSAERRYVTYTNLNPGTYNFKVRATNNDGIWSEKPATMQLIIAPPWWKTIWFRIIVAFTIIGLLFVIYLLRIKNLEKKQLELEYIVLERTKALELQSEQLKGQTYELNQSNNDLKVLNETKDKLFAIIAHDLRNPFNVILGMFDLLKKNFEKYDADRIKNMIDITYSSSMKLYKLLENLLQWSRAQTGNIEYNPEPFILGEQIWTNIYLLEEQAKEKGLLIDCDCSKEAIVLADINLTNAVLRNLLNNAIKFTEKGAVTVKVINNYSSTHVCVQVIDTGVGIRSNTINKLFDIGGITSSTGTKGEKGTGLGLILCKEFVQKNGGKIWVSSTIGEGAVFSFTIPKVGK